MNKFVSCDIKPYMYISDKCKVVMCNEIVNLVINEQLEGYVETVVVGFTCYKVKYLDKVLILEWVTDNNILIGYPIEEGSLLDDLAMNQLEEILVRCEDSMEEYVIKHTPPVQE